jgi:hypothetical protein
MRLRLQRAGADWERGGSPAVQMDKGGRILAGERRTSGGSGDRAGTTTSEGALTWHPGSRGLLLPV